MSRAEQRRKNRNEQKYKTVTYNFTREQLDTYVRDAVTKEVGAIRAQIKEEATHDGVNTAMVLLLTLPMKVLMDHYWKKSAAKRIPGFTSLVLEYYDKWSNGELDMDEMQKDLWEIAGVKLLESDSEELENYEHEDGRTYKEYEQKS